jgi:Transposase DDE domain
MSALPSHPDPQTFLEAWPELLRLLPPDLDALAKQQGCLRYFRAFHAASDLLRALLVYAVRDVSLRTTATWCAQHHLASLSDVALLKQFRQAAPFVEALVHSFFQKRLTDLALPLQVVAVDGSVLKGQKSAGMWTLNLAYTVKSGQTLAATLVPGAGHEALPLAAVQPGQVILGDRLYSKRPTLFAIHEKDAFFVIRSTRTLKLAYQGCAKNPLEILGSTQLEPGESVEYPVTAHWKKQTLAARLVILRCSDAHAQRAQQKTREKRLKDQLDPELSPEAMEAARYLFVLTNLPVTVADRQQVLALYRSRWQIELVFKRWKSVLGLEKMRSKGALGKAYLWAKLLAALLLEELLHQAAFSPWGTRLRG